jgi:hypothetical protein
MLVAPWLELTRMSTAIILLSAFIAKATSGPRLFARTVQRYEIFRPGAAKAVAYFVLVAEAVIGTALLVGKARSTFLLAAGLLFGGFAVLSHLTLRSGSRRIDCGCLGEHVPLRLDSVGVGKNSLLAAACLAMAALSWLAPLEPDSLGAGLPWFVVLACACLLAAMYWLISYASSTISTVELAISGGRR